ncbi:MAG: dockerin type I domain-containing protein [Gammaproteobacteria bacterium]
MQMPGNVLRKTAIAGAAALLAWAPAVPAYNFYQQGGFLGYTFSKWGPPALGTGATVYWSIMPAGTPGAAYCAPGCTNGSGVSGLTLPNFYDWNTHAFRSVNLTDPEVLGYIRNALRTWSATTGVTFVYLPVDSGVPINDPAAEPPPAGATGQIRIGVFDMGDSGSAAAGYAPPPNGFIPNSSQLATGAGDLILNGNAVYAYQNPAGAEGSPLNSYPQGGGLFLNDFEGLILHELGHTLGLDHTATPDAVMCGYTWVNGSFNDCTYYLPQTYVINRQLSSDDATGIQILYGAPVDTDGDSVPDAIDNCSSVSNPAQVDANGDGYGNNCDADLNNSGQVTAADYAILRSVLNQSAASSSTAAAADLNASGTVTAADYAILRSRINTAPGPSGFHP